MSRPCSMPLVALTGFVALAGCGPSRALPAPACRDAADCDDSGMPGAACGEGRCAYMGRIQGTIDCLIDPTPIGRVHLAIYPERAFFRQVGPAPGIAPVAEPLVFDAPRFPIDFELTSLPWGSFTLYAFVAAGGQTRSAARAGVGDWVGTAGVTLGNARDAERSAEILIQSYVSSVTFSR